MKRHIDRLEARAGDSLDDAHQLPRRSPPRLDLGATERLDRRARIDRSERLLRRRDLGNGEGDHACAE
jgi:hypothetical protein